jgi:hypothetical protein
MGCLPALSLATTANWDRSVARVDHSTSPPVSKGAYRLDVAEQR